MRNDLVAVATVRRLAHSDDARRIREQAGISVRELAASLGVSPSTLARWETGHTVPRAPVARRWARTLAALQDPAPRQEEHNGPVTLQE